MNPHEPRLTKEHENPVCHPELVSGSQNEGMLKQVQHDREQGFSGEEIISKTVEDVGTDLRTKVTDEMIENIIRKSAAEVIERVTMEVVPEIAEREIKREIERLKSSE